MRIIVIGAGIVGLAAAHALREHNHDVLIVDRGEPGAQTSRGNAGAIAHADILPLASPKAIRQVANWLLDPLGPLAIRPAYVPWLMPWLARFLWASRPAAVERSTQAIIALQALALPAWERVLAGLGLEGELNRNGMLYVYDDAAAFEEARPSYVRQHALGIPVEEFGPEDVKRAEPALSDIFTRAAFFPSVAHVNDPFELCRKIAEAIRQRGVAFQQAEVSSIALLGADEPPVIVLTGGRTLSADAVVVAAGAWSKPLCAALGDRVPLDTERGYNATIPAPGVAFNRPVLFEGHGFVISPLACGLRVGGAVELAGTEAAPNWKRVDALLAKAARFAPGLQTAGRRDWMGCRPSLPDSLPVISRSRASPRVVYAFGHSHHGLTQAAATAELVAALIADRPLPIDLAPYAAQRF